MKIIKVILSLLFLAEGVMKIIGLDFQVEAFTNWGYPLWFMYLIGVLEIAGAIGLWIPKLFLFANFGLLAIVIGAFYTHISNNDPIPMMSLAFLALVLIVLNLYLYFRKKKRKLNFRPASRKFLDI